MTMSKREKADKEAKAKLKQAETFKKHEKCNDEVTANHISVSVSTLQNWRKKFIPAVITKTKISQPVLINKKRQEQLGIESLNYTSKYAVIVSNNKEVFRDLVLGMGNK